MVSNHNIRVKKRGVYVRILRYVIVGILFVHIILIGFLHLRPHPPIPPYESYIVASESELNPDRVLPFDSVINFRDLGGYKTRQGYEVKRKMIFRSGDLSELSSLDVNRLKGLKVRHVYDLRNSHELELAPDILPSEISYHHIPIYSVDEEPGGFWSTILRVNLEQQFEEFYIHTLVERGAENYGTLINSIAQVGEYPVVIHCTAGKDRTGIASALILLALDVPEEKVIEDYTISNIYFLRIMQQSQQRFDEHKLFTCALNMKAIDVYPYFLAKESTIRKALNYIISQYGSYESYLLNRAKVKPEVLDKLKDDMLTVEEGGNIF